MIDWNGNGRIDPVDVGIGIAIDSVSQANDKTIYLLNYEFVPIQELEPKKNLLGKIKTYNPKDNYSKKDTTPLNKYGKGPFCKFSIDSNLFWGVSGVYALFDDQELLYIGLTQNFAQRFNQGYGIIAPKNCYIGGQSTNCKINAMVLRKYLDGGHIYLYFHGTSDYKRVEAELITEFSPMYNGSCIVETQNQTFQGNLIENEGIKIMNIKSKNSGMNTNVDYTPLYVYFSKQTANEIILSFAEIESILAQQLPNSAYNHDAWWSNSQTSAHPYCHAWLDSGYKTVSVFKNRMNKQMRFVK